MAIERAKTFPPHLGRWGLYEFIEPHLRHLVADRLGVGEEELVPDVDLREDLAVDSLDLLELGLAIEAEFGVTLAERALEQVRRYGDLVETIVDLVGERRQAEPSSDAPTCIAARIAFAEGPPTGTLHRVGWLTPYTVQTIGEDALRAGPGARLQVTVAPANDAASQARVRDAFAWLAARGVQVTITTDDHPRRRPALGARRTPERPAAAGHPGVPG